MMLMLMLMLIAVWAVAAELASALQRHSLPPRLHRALMNRGGRANAALAAAMHQGHRPCPHLIWRPWAAAAVWPHEQQLPRLLQRGSEGGGGELCPCVQQPLPLLDCERKILRVPRE